jgi:hypothetical protein
MDGLFATTTPRNDASDGVAQWDLKDAYKYVSEAWGDGKKGWNAWVEGRKEQWRGIVYSDAIIAAGFAIFALSNPGKSVPAAPIGWRRVEGPARISEAARMRAQPV